MAKRPVAKKRAPTKRPDLRKTVPKIIERIVGGDSLRSICEEHGMPHIATFLRWVSEDDKLREQYARAMELRADFHHEEMFLIADDGRNDWMERVNKDGEFLGWTENGEAVGRSKLRIETRKWSASRMAPKKYGDKVDLNHGGSLDVTGAGKGLVDALAGALAASGAAAAASAGGPKAN